MEIGKTLEKVNDLFLAVILYVKFPFYPAPWATNPQLCLQTQKISFTGI